MATFATLAAADARAISQRDAGVWVDAFSILDVVGQPSVRFLRYMNITDVPAGTFDGMNEAGAWDQTKDDATS